MYIAGHAYTAKPFPGDASWKCGGHKGCCDHTSATRPKRQQQAPTAGSIRKYDDVPLPISCATLG